MNLLFNQDELVSEWVRRRIPHMSNGFGPCVTVGVIGGPDGADLLGAVVFHGYHAAYRSIEWSAAADTANWLSPRVITEIMRYPFEQMGCNRLQAIIARKNVRAREFHRRFGFKQEGLARRGLGKDDATLYGMLLADWRRSPFNADRTMPTTNEAAHISEAQHG